MGVEYGLCIRPSSVQKVNQPDEQPPFKADSSVNKPLTADRCSKRVIMLPPGGFVVCLAFLKKKKHETALPDGDFSALLLRDCSCAAARRRPPNSTEISTKLGAINRGVLFSGCPSILFSILRICF